MMRGYSAQEMVIQFGYVTMFAASFPLAGLFAMLNNIFEMRSDAWLLCVGHQRPPFKPQEDLGSWERVLFIFSLINTVVNAGLTAFVGAQLDDSGGTFTTRIRDPRLWAIAVMIEHAVLSVKFILKTLMPSEPDWITGAKEVLGARISTESAG
jgi:anoctamin-10